MSTKAVVKLFKNEKTKEELRAITNEKEITRIGRKNGLIFTNKEFEIVKQAVIDLQNKKNKAKTLNCNQYEKQSQIEKENISFNHELSYDREDYLTECYEFYLHDIQGFEKLEDDLEKIKSKPDIADIDLFNETFKIDDFYFASISPESKDFQEKYQEIMSKINNNITQDSPEPEHCIRRDFHLINLDSYVKDEIYDDYFQSKLRIVRTLTNFFDADVKLTGSFCYPPNAYRLWHTNDDAPGWRMYLIDFDRPELSTNGKSFFRYMHPETKELVTLLDKPKLVRFFKIEQQQEKLFWHCIVNGTKAYRWSYGFRVPDNWMEKIKLHTVKSCE